MVPHACRGRMSRVLQVRGGGDPLLGLAKVQGEMGEGNFAPTRSKRLLDPTSSFSPNSSLFDGNRLDTDLTPEVNSQDHHTFSAVLTMVWSVAKWGGIVTLFRSCTRQY